MRSLLYRFSFVLVLLLVVSVPPALAIPEEAQDDETYDLSVTGIFPHPDGEVCARQIDSDRYRIKLVNSDVTGFETTFLKGTPREHVLRSDRIQIDGELYMFTTGKNELISLLGLSQGLVCVSIDIEQRFSFDVYYLEGENLDPVKLTFETQ